MWYGVANKPVNWQCALLTRDRGPMVLEIELMSLSSNALLRSPKVSADQNYH